MGWTLIFKAIKRGVIKNSHFMTSEQAVIDQELAQFGWVESITTNSIINFKSPNLNVVPKNTEERNSDYIGSCIYHMIFYVIFCFSFFIYVFIDLGLNSFVESKVTTLIKLKRRMK